MQNIHEDIADWRKAGAIAAEALEFGRKQIKVGASMLEILDSIEQKIFDLGGQIGFPAQMNFGDIAAHDCADPEDDRVIPETVVKLDVGAAFNGAIGDNAVSVDLTGEYGHLLSASRDALDAAIKVAGVGVSIGEVGKVIEEAIRSHDCIPIRNLSGHGLARFKVHCNPSMINWDSGDTTVLQDHMVVAVEPFSTTGNAGLVRELDYSNVFMVDKMKPVRSPISRELLEKIKTYQGLPFTTRWLTKEISPAKVNFGLRDLLKNGVIRGYPPLKEESGGMVAQFENTLYIRDKVERLTRLE